MPTYGKLITSRSWAFSFLGFGDRRNKLWFLGLVVFGLERLTPVEIFLVLCGPSFFLVFFFIGGVSEQFIEGYLITEFMIGVMCPVNRNEFVEYVNRV